MSDGRSFAVLSKKTIRSFSFFLVIVGPWACSSPRSGLSLDGGNTGAGTGGTAGAVLGDASLGSGGNPADAVPSADVPPGSGGGGGADASAGDRDGAAPLDAPQAEIGGACTTAADCRTGSCVDGFCCDSACDGVCMACAQAFTGMPDGTCAQTRAGLSAHRECFVDSANVCGNDGTCDGAGKCRKSPSSKVCAPASCSATAVFSGASTCDGAGKCVAPGPVACSPYTCAAASGCVQTCAADGECLGASYCTATMTCAPKKVDGARCDVSKECLHGFCADNVCCNTACTGACLSCATTQAMGICSPEPAGKVESSCLKDTANACGTDGTCDGLGACRKAVRGTSCGAATCTGATLTGARTCDGSGVCTTPAAAACPGALTCGSATSCRATCGISADCTAGSYCLAGRCVPKLADGVACTPTDECSSGHCVEGICCNSACGTVCHSCRAAKTNQSEGVCSPIGAGTSCGTNMVCSAAGTCGTCVPGGACQPCKEGTITCASGAPVCSSTANKPAGTSCGATQACRNSVKTAAYLCNSSGTCVTPTSTNCPFGCNAAGTDCELGPCDKNPECTAGTSKSCGVCTQTQLCSTSCSWGACGGTIRADCCPMPFNDHWTAALSDISRPWWLAFGDPRTTTAADNLILSYDDVVRRASVSGGYTISFSLTFSAGTNQVFTFDFGEPTGAQLYPAIRQINGKLQLGGARYGNNTTWAAFGDWSGTGTMYDATTVTVTLYVKSKALAARVRVGAETKDTQFVNVPSLDPQILQMTNLNHLSGDNTGLMTVSPISGCAGFPDAVLDSLHGL